MPYPYFRAIISSPETVVSLKLDNSQGFEQCEDRNRNLQGQKNSYYYLVPGCFSEEDEDGLPLARHSGPMRGHLNVYRSRFERLQHLAIHTIGQQSSLDTRWFRAREKARYIEVADFVRSVASTLLTWRCGPSSNQRLREVLRNNAKLTWDRDARKTFQLIW